jgi:hypothetical protein
MWSCREKMSHGCNDVYVRKGAPRIDGKCQKLEEAREDSQSRQKEGVPAKTLLSDF